MSRRRPLVFWVLLAACAALAAWWLFHVPFSETRLYGAVPANAVFVSQHRRLAGRWEAFAANPVTRSLLTSLGVSPSDLDDVANDPAFRSWLKKLAGDDVVLAYVPELGEFGEPAWVFASWLGGRSQRLRWQLSSGRIPGYVPLQRYQGRACWLVKDSSLKEDLVLTISFTEGMLVGCLSRHAGTLKAVLDTCDGILPSMAARTDFPLSRAWCTDPLAADRGWVVVNGLDGRLVEPPRVLSYDVTRLTADGIVGDVCGEAKQLTAQRAVPQLKTSGLEKILGGQAFAVAMAQTALIGPGMERPERPAWLRLFAELLREQDAETVAAALFGEDCSGRFKGLKVPTAVVAVPLANPAEALAWMSQALDRLNALYRWGLVSRAVNAGVGTLYAIEGSTEDSPLASLTVDECPAYTICNGWLVLASNLSGLEQIVRHFAQAATHGPSAKWGWQYDIDEVRAPAYAWTDMNQGGKTLRLALATYSLKLLVEDPEGSRATRQRLNEAKAWIDSFAPLHFCRLWLRSDGEMMDVTFRLGP